MRAPVGWEAIQAEFGPFPIIGQTIGGQPILDPKWVKAHIVRMDFCGHPIQHHHKLADVLSELRYGIHFRRLDPEIRRMDSFVMRWVRRHSGFLSTHGIGIAFDLNPEDNVFGSPECTIHPEIVKLFRDAGFEHGADWRHPDPMHFQFCWRY